MKQTLRLAAIVALATGLLVGKSSVLAQSSRTAEAQLKAAQHKEEIEGDVKGAIAEYKKIVAGAGTNRSLAARVLLRLAGAYQLLGDSEARRTYEQIVKSYEDQKDAVAIARARLGRPAIAPVLGDRAVWTGPDVDLFGTVSPDGRFLTYVDWNGNQNLMLRDLVANTSRPLTNNRKPSEFGTADFSAISRDGAQVAFWMNGFRVASLRSSGVPTSRVVRTGEYLRPFNWSPDNKSVAVLVDRQQIGIVSVEDGALSRLKWMDWLTVDNIVFSPDGRFIAYDAENADRRGRRDIMVMAVDGAKEVPVAADTSFNYLMGWSADGDIVFTSDRTGARSLWALRVENGQRKGEPRLVRPDIRATFSLGLTPSGTLFVHQQASPGHVSIASFDAVQGKVLESDAARPSFQQFIEQRGWPRWSADGRHLMFFSCDVRNWPCALFIRDGNTRVVREVTHDMGYVAFAGLSPDGHAVIANGSDVKGRRGIFLIDAATGATSMVVSRGQPDHRDPAWSRDGKAIRYSEIRDKDLVLLEQEIGSEQSKEIFRTTNEGISRMEVSPDGRLVGFVRRRGTGTPESRVFVVAPLAGGAPRELVTPPGVPDTFFWQWAPDSQSVILQKGGGEGIELWQLPLTGSSRKLDIDGRQWSSFHISPDGKQIAFEARTGKSGNEVWALENFLPASSAKR